MNKNKGIGGHAKYKSSLIVGNGPGVPKPPNKSFINN